MKRKVFISVLGTTFYEPYKYSKDEKVSSRTPFVQEAMLELLGVKEWSNDDRVWILLTQGAKGARDANWLLPDNKRFNARTNQHEDYKGLGSRIEEMGLKTLTEDISIPDGQNEQEMDEIFNTLFSKFNEEDEYELYVDLTHSFRYLPMLLLVLLNYVRFLRKVEIKTITYGNVEAARNKGLDTAPIIDLLPLVTLQDWTYAAGSFADTGNPQGLVRMSQQRLRPVLRKGMEAPESARQLNVFVKKLQTAINDITMCRGLKIYSSENIGSVLEQLNEVDCNLIPQLSPLIRKIGDDLYDFSISGDYANGFAAARWCLKHGYYQQAVTICQESVVTVIASDAGIKDWNDEKARKALVERSLYNIVYKVPEERWIIWEGDEERSRDVEEYRRGIMRKVQSLPFSQKVANLFESLKTSRNDINHSGVRPPKANPASADSLRESITKNITHICELFEETSPHEEYQPQNDARTPLFVNLTNHPSERWGEEQKAVAEMYGAIVDMPFPAIEPGYDEREISQLADDYLAKIVELQEEHIVTVHLMGEFTFCAALLKRLRAAGIECVASCTERITTEADGIKTSIFKFVRFRTYE